MDGAPSRTARIAWVAAAIAAVFVAWILAGSATAGIAFFFSIPVGLASWWFGLRAGLLAAHVCVALFALIAEGETFLLGWADRPIRDDMCLLVLKPRTG